jgi:hypothetical protein
MTYQEALQTVSQRMRFGCPDHIQAVKFVDHVNRALTALREHRSTTQFPIDVLGEAENILVAETAEKLRHGAAAPPYPREITRRAEAIVTKEAIELLRTGQRITHLDGKIQQMAKVTLLTRGSKRVAGTFRE